MSKAKQPFSYGVSAGPAYRPYGCQSDRMCSRSGSASSLAGHSEHAWIDKDQGLSPME